MKIDIEQYRQRIRNRHMAVNYIPHRGDGAAREAFAHRFYDWQFSFKYTGSSPSDFLRSKLGSPNFVFHDSKDKIEIWEGVTWELVADHRCPYPELYIRKGVELDINALLSHLEAVIQVIPAADKILLEEAGLSA